MPRVRDTYRRTRLRAVWISDLHLGTPSCQARKLLHFLRHHEAEHLYLVGDILDGWCSRRWVFEEPHRQLIDEIFRWARRGCKVTYVCGNHDEFLRVLVDSRVGPFDIVDETEHVTADGRRLLILHGDVLDQRMVRASWLTRLGDRAYKWSLALNRWVDVVQRSLSSLRSLETRGPSSTLVHDLLNPWMSPIAQFRDRACEEARRRGFDGVVCGHVHAPEIREHHGVLYCNDGDWVVNCTALVEQMDGRLDLLTWNRHAPDSLPVWEEAAV